LFSLISGWAQFDGSSTTFYQSKQRIRDAALAPNGFYLATQRGLFFHDTLSKKEVNVGDKLLESRIEDIEKVGETYFFATLGSGLVVKDKVSTKSILKENGLFSNQINKLYFENDSVLWVCTNMGLNRIVFDQKTGYSITGLSKSDGLVYNNITDVEVIGDTVWVGTRAGLCSFPKSIFDEYKYQRFVDYHLRFFAFEVNDQNVSSNRLSALSYDQNKLTFYFKAVSFKNRSNLIYRYRIPFALISESKV
jgi:hypothetical protein